VVLTTCTESECMALVLEVILELLELRFADVARQPPHALGEAEQSRELAALAPGCRSGERCPFALEPDARARGREMRRGIP